MRKYLIFILSMYVISCSVELDYNAPAFEPKLVINGFLQPDSLISINVRSTSPILSRENVFIEDAEVTLSVNGEFVETLTYKGSGNYKSEIQRPETGKVYSVEIIADGYDKVTASDTIPGNVKILTASMVKGNTYNEYGDPDTDYNLSFADGKETDYYELMFIGQSPPTAFNSKYTIGIMRGVVIADPVMKDDSDLDLNPPTFLFTDNLFQGENYTLNVKMNAGSGGDFTSPIVPAFESGHFVVLRSVSHSYYKYVKSWYRHKLGKQEANKIEAFMLIPLLGDPAEMYSNIEGGYGIFTSFYQSYYKVENLTN